MGTFAWRLTASLATLTVFVVTVVTLVVGLFALPPGLVVLAFSKGSASGNVWGWIFIFAVCWGTSYLLARGLARVRPVRFVPPSEPLRRVDAPALFALVDELAQRAETRPPQEIYLSPGADLSVAETGGLFGWRSRRVLVIGAPLLTTCTVDELRAGLAHELGHFAGGHTRLSSLLAFTENVFRSVWLSTQEAPEIQDGHIGMAYEIGRAIAKGLVWVFLKLFLWSTRPGARRQELDADRLSVALAGRRAARDLLDKVHVLDPTYSFYIDEDVEPFLRRGVLPSDLLDGFDRFRARTAERGIEAKVAEAVAAVKTDPFDTHPSLADRRAHIDDCVEDPSGREPDSRRARALLADSFDLEAWLTAKIISDAREVMPNLRSIAWNEIIEKVVPAFVVEDARRFARILGRPFDKTPTAAHRLRALLAAYEAGELHRLAYTLEPQLAHLPPDVQRPLSLMVGARTLTTFFQDALLERGAEVVALLGEPCAVYRYQGEMVLPRELACAAVENGEAAVAMRAWQKRLTEATQDENAQGASNDSVRVPAGGSSVA